MGSKVEIMVEVIEVPYKDSWVKVRVFDGTDYGCNGKVQLKGKVIGEVEEGYGKLNIWDHRVYGENEVVMRYRSCGRNVELRGKDIRDKVYEEANVSYILTGLYNDGVRVSEDGDSVEVLSREGFEWLLSYGYLGLSGGVSVVDGVSLGGYTREDFQCIGCKVIYINEEQANEVDWGEVEELETKSSWGEEVEGGGQAIYVRGEKPYLYVQEASNRLSDRCYKCGVW